MILADEKRVTRRAQAIALENKGMRGVLACAQTEDVGLLAGAGAWLTGCEVSRCCAAFMQELQDRATAPLLMPEIDRILAGLREPAAGDSGRRERKRKEKNIL